MTRQRPSFTRVILGTLLVLAGIAAAVVTVLARRSDNVALAGIAHEGTGHHHLLIDVDLPRLDAPIPADDAHVHFGAGQTETTLTLPPGEHTLQLLIGDELHVPHDPPVMSEPLTIRVQ